MRYVPAFVILTLVYALTLASFELWDLLIGAGISAALLFFFGRLVFETDSESGLPALGRVVGFFPFAAAVAWEALRGAWDVLLATLHVRKPSSPGIVSVPLEERTRTGAAVSALIAALTPGTLLVDVDEDEWVMWIHALNAADPEAVREEQQRLYRRYQRKVFP